MKQVKRTMSLKQSLSMMLGLFTMLLVFSCKKSSADMPVQKTSEAVAAMKSTALQNDAKETITNEQTVFVPCANNGIGEDVQLTGSIVSVDKIVYNQHGFTLTYHSHTKGVKGIGLTTGNEYNAIGGTQNTITGTFENNRFSGTTIEQLRIVGNGTNFIMKYHFHVTVTADGTFTSSISDEKVECK